MTVVTLSYQIGSLGGEVAQHTARLLNLELIDRHQVHTLAESCDDEYKDACSTYALEEFGGFLERLSFDRPAYKSLFEALNFELAGRDQVMLLGRGAQVVLKDVPGVFHARIIAPETIRVERVAARQGLTSREAWHLVRDHEHHRKTLIESVFRVDPGDYFFYDIILNTAHYNSETAAELLVQGTLKKEQTGDQAGVIDEMKNLATAKRLESIIRKQVRTAPFMEGVTVSLTADGTVVLNGLVRSRQDVEVAQKIAEDTAGGAEMVDNQLRIYSLIR
ncbi:MAG: cytidylate kinase family protein [Deltaproteobacteria bacterium]|jgi:cytidylate kinase|nr:cytidylate kinase family protein [Deltaproteobacteria bacterium]